MDACTSTLGNRISSRYRVTLERMYRKPVYLKKSRFTGPLVNSNNNLIKQHNNIMSMV